MDFKEAVAGELRSLRAISKMTQQEISEKADVNISTIVRYENNQITMNLDILDKIVKAYGIDCYIFFNNVNAKTHTSLSKNE